MKKKRKKKMKQRLSLLLAWVLLASGMDMPSYAAGQDAHGSNSITETQYDYASNQDNRETMTAETEEAEDSSDKEETDSADIPTDAANTEDTEIPSSPDLSETKETDLEETPGMGETDYSEETPNTEETDYSEETSGTEEPLPSEPASDGQPEAEETDMETEETTQDFTNDAAEYEAPLDLNNYNASFKTLDEETVTATANGKPKLLVFFKVGCYNSQTTIKNIASATGFPDVDIYAIEINKNTKEIVAEFKNTYGSDNITFSYDTTNGNSSFMWSYASAAGFGTSVTLPVVCYIDSNNKFQHATTSLCTANLIMDNLEYYCSAAPTESYTITYILNGGTNHSGNPASYQPSSASIVLQDPAREGYSFTGWYRDAGFTQKVTQIDGSNTGNITLYAKWEILAATDNLNLDNFDFSFTTIDDEILSSASEGRPKLLVFFGANCGRSQATLRSISQYGFTDVDIYALELQSASQEEVIAFKNTYGGNNIVYACDPYGYQHNRYASEYIDAAGSDAKNYPPCLVYIDANNKIQYLTTGSATGASVDANLKKYCGAAQPAPSLPEVDMTLTEGNLLVGFSGAYYTETAEKILGRLNEIRLEACREGVLDPYTKKPLTESDYVPLQWSSSLEAITRLRAAEAAISQAHTRPNGNGCFTAKTVRGEQSYGENLAWNYTGLMYGIEQWYEEKDDWVNNGSGQTGHYESIISTRFRHVAVSAFRLSTGGFFSVAQEFSHETTMDPLKDATEGNCVQNIEVKADAVSALGFVPAKPAKIENGSTAKLSLQASVLYKDCFGKDQTYTGTVTAGGTWSSSDENIVSVDQSGTVTAKNAGTATVTVTAGTKSATLEIIVDGSEKSSLEEGSTTITLSKGTYVYNGAYHQPEVFVVFNGTLLAAGADYQITYQNNKNAGTATLTVTGIGNYEGSVSTYFEIQPAKLTITAKDKKIRSGSPAPAQSEYECTVSGLAAGEKLLKEPYYTCSVKTPAVSGIYDIVPGGAEAGSNYEKEITYKKGTLTVSEENVAYIVSFDVQGHGTAPGNYIVKAGATIAPPAEPAAPDYQFDGWYQDAACTKAWDFTADIVQKDTTLYAKWLMTSAGDLRVQEINDVCYTGKACKPAVSVYDGDTLLKPNKDYKITYVNNTNANAVPKKGNGTGSNFNEALPYVNITGKGNYSTDALTVNFNILPAPIGDKEGNPAAGITLQYTEQLVANRSKALSPFRSVKYKKSMKQDTDYTVSLTPKDAFDETGNALNTDAPLKNAQIPAGYTGSFELTIKGAGNYTGMITKEVFVAEKTKLLKNAKITLGKNLKKISLTGGEIKLTPAYYDKEAKKYYLVEEGKITKKEANAADVFTVSCGGENLVYQKDFDINYDRQGKAGKATLTVTGLNAYAGSKSVSFQITGAALKANTVTVEGLENKTFTGKAITQNDVRLIYHGSGEDKTLDYGTDYTISYKKNIGKGTASITFKAAEGSVYSGSFSKTFRIEAADITDQAQVTQEGLKDISVRFEKAGAKPSGQIKLTNAAGLPLQNGRDYTVSYRNNKAVASAKDENPPTMTIKGKGNYKGTIAEIPFTITEALLDDGEITVSVTPMAYNAAKAADYEYKPSVKLKQGKSTLSPAKDYEISYVKNTQMDYESYLKKLEEKNASDSDMPAVVIKAREGGNYKLDSPSGELRIPLPVYQNKLTKKNLYVVIGEAGYSGTQVRPTVDVYYNNDVNVVASAKGLTKEKDILALGLEKLTPDTEYTLSYGANITAGINKGSVKITGVQPYYGGSVTVKFTIQKKQITW